MKLNGYKKFISLLSGLVLLMASISSFALDSDSTQLLTIHSDWMEYNRNTGISVYKGKVTLDQGSSHLTADKLVVYLNAQHKLTKAIATGELARYNTIMEVGKPPIFAQAQEMDYMPADHKVVLIGKAQVTQDQDVFQGSRIIYDMQTKIVTTLPDPHERTTIVIQPQHGSPSAPVSKK